MANYSSGEKSRARALIIGVVLLVGCVGLLCASLRHHDKFTAVFAAVIILLTILGLYSALTEN